MRMEHPPERQLRILQVNTSDRSGGAQRAAWNLFQTYRARGHKSWLAVGYKRTDDPDVLVIPKGNRFPSLWNGIDEGVEQGFRWLESKMRGVWRLRHYYETLRHPVRVLEKSLGLESFHHPATRRMLQQLSPEKPDILHCHNLHGYYFDLRVLPWLSRQVPVILNLHDAWLLSGHCAHSLECERWRIGCGSCPYLRIYPAIYRDATAYNWRSKKEFNANSTVYVTNPGHYHMCKDVM